MDRLNGEVRKRFVPVRPEEVAPGLTLEEVQELRGFVYDGVSDGSAVVYERHMNYFEAWCKRREVQLSAVETDHIRAYMQEKRVVDRISASWMYCASAAIKMFMVAIEADEQVVWEEVHSKIRTYRKRVRRRPNGVDGLTRARFEQIKAVAWIPRNGEWADKAARRAALDLALIALMRDCLLRREEAAAVTWGDIKVERRGQLIYGVLTIPFGKTDQYGNGEVGYIDITTLALLQEMAVLSGRNPAKKNQKVFGIGGKQISNRIRAACEAAGLKGRFRGHSPRVGMAMDLVTNDTPLVGVMQSGRWRVPGTLIRYVRSIAAGDGAVARLHRRWERLSGGGAGSRSAEWLR